MHGRGKSLLLTPVILLAHIRSCFKKRMAEAATQVSQGEQPVHSREVPLPLIRDYFEALTPTIPKSARSPLRANSKKLGSVGTVTMGAA